MDKRLPPPLSAKHSDSIAYKTVRDKLPIICTRATDYVHRQHSVIKEKFGQPGETDLKTLVRAISKLRYEVMTDKPVTVLTDESPDTNEWNLSIQEMTSWNGGEPISWFSGPWLFLECYMYRRIREGVRLCPVLNHLDVFGEQKRNAFMQSVQPITSLLKCLSQVINQHISQPTNLFQTFKEFLMLADIHFTLLKAAVWGERSELSVWSGHNPDHKDNLLVQLSYMSPHLLADHTDAVFYAFNASKASRNRSGKVDFVLNNAGLELVADLCLADFLLYADMASRVHLHGKAMPWCVMDVTKEDLDWTLGQIAASPDPVVASLGKRWSAHLLGGTWSFSAEDFWTLPYDYCRMEDKAPDLYKGLEEANMILFKGNLNYRKLVGDLDWDPATSFQRSLRGFQPTALCVLRTLRADVVTGLREGQAAQLTARDPHWKCNGNWGLIEVAATASRRQSET